MPCSGGRLSHELHLLCGFDLKAERRAPEGGQESNGMRHPPELSPHSWATLEVASHVEIASPAVPLNPAGHTP